MARRRGNQRPKGPSNALQVSIPARPAPYKVSLTEPAERMYRELRRRSLEAEARGDHSNQHCTSFRMVDEAIRTLIPADPTNRKYALHKPLDELFRIAKGRTRIAWAVDTEHREVLIVFISDEPRKEGDVRDPYAVLTNMVKQGYLSDILNDWRRAFYTPPNTSVN